MPVLIIQMGHCYRRSGATGTDGEQAYATRVAEACVRLLGGRNGWRVNPTLADENDYRGDAFVAVHCDGSIHSTARGASVGYRTPEGQQLGQAWKRAYAARGWTGFRLDNYTSALSGYYGTRNAVAAGTRRAIIIECGFRTNSADRAALDGPGGVDRVALAIGDALGITSTPVEDDDMNLTDRVDWDAINKLGPDYVGHKILGTWQNAAAARVLGTQILAAVTTDADITPERLDASVDKAIAAHMPTAEETAAALLPLVEDIAQRVLGADNKALAGEFIRQLRDALPANEGN